MSDFRSVRQPGALVTTAVLSIGSVFVSEAAAVKSQVPVSICMDINSRRTSTCDGYSAYVPGYRASRSDAFTVTKDRDSINLDGAAMNYYPLIYGDETQKYLEYTVYSLKEGTHYPTVRSETMEREEAADNPYEHLNRCYMVEFCYGDTRSSMYFSVFPKEDMNVYRNIPLGEWKEETRRWKYKYQDEALMSWALISEKWYYSGADGYTKTGQQNYKGGVYYLSPGSSVMRADCTIDGFRLNSSGRQVDQKHEKSCTRQVRCAGYSFLVVGVY